MPVFASRCAGVGRCAVCVGRDRLCHTRCVWQARRFSLRWRGHGALSSRLLGAGGDGALLRVCFHRGTVISTSIARPSCRVGSVHCEPTSLVYEPSTSLFLVYEARNAKSQVRGSYGARIRACSHTRLVWRFSTRLVRGREGFSAYEARTEVQYEARKEECGGEAMWVECMGAQ